MMSDEQFRRAGEELDRLSASHTPPQSDPRARRLWLTVAASLVVVASVVGIAILGPGSNDTSSIAPAPSTSSGAATTSVSTPAGGSTVATSSPASTTTTIASTEQKVCIAGQVETKVSLPLQASLSRVPACAPGYSANFVVTNRGTSVCTSDQMATLGQTRMWFVSASGFGGVVGHWEPVPDSVVDATGVIEYPVGTKSWPITLPAVNDPFGDAFTVSVTCDGVTKPLSVQIQQAPDFPHSDVPVKNTNTFADVKYYNPCGDSSFEFKGYTLYPLLPAQATALDRSNYPAPPSPNATYHTLLHPAVAPPGPGDDVGTLALYEDGIARFESKSGRISWFTNAPQTYSWKC